MALVQFNFESEYLGYNHSVSIILPDKPRNMTPAEFYGSGVKYKVLWLLHGFYGDHTDWLRKSNIELYACERDLIVVMPSAMNSGYASWPTYPAKFNMYKYFTEELMPLVYNWFPASDKREDNFIAGLSMGGGGTIKFAVNYPEKFAGAAMLSMAPSDMSFLKPYAKMPVAEFAAAMAAGKLKDVPARPMLNGMNAFATVQEFLDSYENVWNVLTDKVKNGEDLPKIYAACGTEDFLYETFVKFRKHCEAIGAPVVFEEIKGYAHEWRFWDLTIQKAITFFGLDKPKDAGNPF